ncbi:LptF/LptG family permease [Rubripirellula amarantea]|nr:LptF/LptG family permease [Rubripirellula amarantea]
MTQIDRYILTLFLRTVVICFCSIAGVFIVFSAFTSMDDFVKLGQSEGGLVKVMARYYGPFMLLMFDWTGAIIAMMAFLFTVGWLRRTGELTSTLAAGISHGRLLRPMIVASLLIVGAQMVNREFVLPQYRDALSMKAKDINPTMEQDVKAKYDKVNRVLIDGTSMIASNGTLQEPNFRLDGNLVGFGDMILAKEAKWMEASPTLPSGFLLNRVRRPEQIDTLASAFWQKRPVLLTSHDQDWLQPGQCFLATSVSPDLLQASESATRRASIPELVAQVRNPAVHSSMGLQVLLHERIVRPPLDFALIMLALPMVVNRKGRNLFVMIGAAMVTVMGFFLVKTVASMIGSGGYMISPGMAAWVPLIVFGPIAYVRLREVQLV